MKVAFVNDVIYMQASGTPAVVGGAERQQWLLARALAAAGWTVSVGVRTALKAGERRSLHGVEFVGIEKDYVLTTWHSFLRAERPDWWYWRCADHLFGPAVTLAHRHGVRTIFSAGSDRDVRPRSASFRRRRWWPLYAWGLARTDRIFLQHERQKSRLASVWRSKSHIVPSLVGCVDQRPRHHVRGGFVVWAGDLNPAKRPDRLLEVARRCPQLRFAVCGDANSLTAPPGYGTAIVEALNAMPNVRYLGMLQQADAHQLIADGAVLLSTSDNEGFPNTFLQAWASGTPVVSLNIDPGNIISSLGLGIVSGYVETAAADLHELLDCPKRRDVLAERAREHVAKTHSDAAVVAAFDRALHG